MWVVPVLFGLGCAAAIWFAARSGDPDAVLLAFELAAVWAIANVLWLTDNLEYMPALDWIVGCQAIVIACVRDEKWVRFFILLIAIRLTLHVVDYLTAHAFLVQYIDGLNALFALMLMVVSYAGGVHGRDTVLGHLYRLGAWLRPSHRTPAPRLTV